MGYFATHASRHGGISSTQDAQLRGLEEEDPDEGLAEEELGFSLCVFLEARVDPVTNEMIRNSWWLNVRDGLQEFK